MDANKARKIIDLALGLKHYEWNKINHLVEQAFKKAEAEIELTPELAQSAKAPLEIEEGGEAKPPQAKRTTHCDAALFYRRKAFEDEVVQNFESGDLYITLTWRPGEFRADMAPKQTRDFIRRVKRQIKRNLQPTGAFRWMYICDIRPARHILLHGPTVSIRKQIEAQWKYGLCMVQEIKAPTGNLAAYLAERAVDDTGSAYFAGGRTFIHMSSDLMA